VSDLVELWGGPKSGGKVSFPESGVLHIRCAEHLDQIVYTDPKKEKPSVFEYPATKKLYFRHSDGRYYTIGFQWATYTRVPGANCTYMDGPKMGPVFGKEFWEGEVSS
jgi:hypothetical protein